MFGKNQILKPENGDGENLKVTSIFPTFQGEGPLAGHPSVFIRLSGCNLACDFCDTEFDSFKEFSIDEITKKTLKLSVNEEGKRVRNLIVITGGEPLRQEISPLCDRLLQEGFEVQIETNGTLYRKLDSRIQIICSPKVSNGKYHFIRPDLLPHINAFKFIISDSRDGYQDILQGIAQEKQIAIYLQPMDEYDENKNRANAKRALELANKYGCRISIQMHKILGIE